MKRMQPDTIRRHRIKWLKALLSGKYKQGRGKLKQIEEYVSSSKDKYCCLGVACELSGTGKWLPVHIESRIESRIDYYLFQTGKRKEQAGGEFMPPKAARWLGITKEFQTCLAEKNDAGQSFKTIARFCADRWKINLKRITSK